MLIAAFLSIFSILTVMQDSVITIVVTDSAHAVVSGARVSVYPPGASSPQTGLTDETGTYRVSAPFSGSALVQVDREGFRKSSKTVTVSGGAVREEFVLAVAGVDTQVVVTASDTPQTVDQITKALTVVGAQEIDDRDEYTVAGVLGTVPGVLVHNVGGPGQLSTIRVRGLRPDSAAVLIDGMRFRDAATAQGDASSFLSNLNFISVDRVEVLRGSGSSLYGTNAASGVVNIVSDQGGGPTHGSLQVEGGNLGFLRGRTQLSGGAFGDRLKYSAGMVHLNFMSGVDGDDRARSSGLQSFARYDAGPKTSLYGRFFGSDDFAQNNISPTASGIPAANITGVVVPAIALAPDQVARLLAGQTPSYGPATYIPGRNDPDSRRTSRFYSASIRLQQSLLPRLSVQTSYQRTHTRRIYMNGPGGAGFQPLAVNYSRFLGDIDTIDLRSVVDVTRWNQLTAGYEFEREQYQEIQDNNLAGTQRLRTQTSIRQNANAVYFQDQSSLLQGRFQVSLSGRLQSFGLKKPVFDTTGIADNYNRVNLSSPHKAATADASISYFVPRSGTKFRAHAGNAYRAPSLFERFGGGFFQDPSTGVVIFSPYGDPFLTPDRYNSFDGGIDQYLLRDRVRIASTYFYSRVATITAFDLGTVIQAATDPYGRTSGYINGSGGSSRGLELSVDARPTGTLSLRGSYTYVRAGMDRDITVPGFWRTLGVPRHASTLVATYRFMNRGTAAMDLTQNSEVYGNLTAAGRSRAYRYPSYAKGDVSGSYDLHRSEQHTVKFTARAENIFNRTVYDLGWLSPRATFAMGLTFQY